MKEKGGTDLGRDGGSGGRDCSRGVDTLNGKEGVPSNDVRCPPSNSTVVTEGSMLRLLICPHPMGSSACPPGVMKTGLVMLHK